MDKKQAIFEALLPLVAFEGWNKATLSKASKEAGFDAKMHEIVFPHGVNEVLGYFSTSFDQKMTEALEKKSLETLKIREKIATIVRTRLELYADIKPTIRQTVSYASLPYNLVQSTKMLWRTVDHMWRLAGDTSTDFNYYTKRTLLASVYSSTLLYWLKDESKDHEATWQFLDRRIENVLLIGKVKAKLCKSKQ